MAENNAAQSVPMFTEIIRLTGGLCQVRAVFDAMCCRTAQADRRNYSNQG
jgi:hypothetical protein